MGKLLCSDLLLVVVFVEDVWYGDVGDGDGQCVQLLLSRVCYGVLFDVENLIWEQV